MNAVASLLALALALALPACSGAIETAGPDVPPCDPDTITVRLVRADLTPYTLDAYSACRAPDAPELYGRVWCCPPARVPSEVRAGASHDPLDSSRAAVQGEGGAA